MAGAIQNRSATTTKPERQACPDEPSWRWARPTWLRVFGALLFDWPAQTP
jgi:hypothetical protein